MKKLVYFRTPLEPRPGPPGVYWIHPGGLSVLPPKILLFKVTNGSRAMEETFEGSTSSPLLCVCLGLLHHVTNPTHLKESVCTACAELNAHVTLLFTLLQQSRCARVNNTTHVIIYVLVQCGDFSGIILWGYNYTSRYRNTVVYVVSIVAMLCVYV